MKKIIVFSGGMAIAAIVLFTGYYYCCRDSKIAFDNKFFRFLENAGYTIHPMPSTLERGGSLVVITKGADGATKADWVSDLASCGVPDAIMFPSGDQTKSARFPPTEISGENEIDPSVAFSLVKRGLEGDGRIGTKATISVEGAGKEVLDRLSVAAFLLDPITRNQLKPACIAALERQTTAVIVDAAFIDRAVLKFFKDDELNVRLSVTEIEGIADLTLRSGAKIKEDGTMEISERMYVGFRSSFFLPDTGMLSGGKGLDAEDLPDADHELDEALER